MNIYQEYLEAIDAQKKASARVDDLKCKIYEKHQENLTFDTGTYSCEDDGFSVRIVKKESVSVDSKMASKLGYGFRVKYELDKKSLKSLTPQQVYEVEKCITTKPSKPSFSVEVI